MNTDFQHSLIDCDYTALFYHSDKKTQHTKEEKPIVLKVQIKINSEGIDIRLLRSVSFQVSQVKWSEGRNHKKHKRQLYYQERKRCCLLRVNKKHHDKCQRNERVKGRKNYRKYAITLKGK